MHIFEHWKTIIQTPTQNPKALMTIKGIATPGANMAWWKLKWK